ncbi:MAG TPA: hypothetical protein VF587_06420 [Solirubrobacteraceae bacterium]|jgi:hypothetical protein
MRSNMKWFFAGVVVLALTASPFALAAGEGRALFGGERNPSNNPALSLREETEVIATTSTYGTRQSNKSDNGGGAIYGCRSGAGGSAAENEPCIRAVNLSDGRAFELVAQKGTEGGTIEVGAGGDGTRPFTTNATGVATGLNADRVDGLDGGQVAPRLARVRADGILLGGRGAITAARTSEGLYTVRFGDDITNCNYSGQQVETGDNAGATLVELIDPNTLRVRTRNGGGADGTGPNANGDHPFHVQVFC